MSRWHIKQYLAVCCFALPLVACDDVLEGKTDDSDQCSDDCASGGGSWHHGGGDGDGHTDSPDDGYGDVDASSLVVTAECGDIEGRHVACGEDGEGRARAFLGIPYAQPPVEDLRFMAPQPPHFWSGRLKATRFGPSCIQSAAANSVGLGKESEDCLYLNVWTPAPLPEHALPVLVWFHGGEHAHGSAAELSYEDRALFDGRELTQRNLIVVSVNYRLGPLGFLAHEQLEDERLGTLGNQGLWDQRAALRWVKDNIEAFGGDPENVTIAGQGSGATDVCLHVVSPESRGLFAHVIQQSGGCTTYQPSASELQRRARLWLRELSCDNDEVFACLRDTSVGDLYAALPAASPGAFVPGVDGHFLPDQPRSMFSRKDIADVTFLMGSNAEDGSLYMGRFPDVQDEDAYHATMQEMFPQMSLQELCEVYPHDRFESMKRPYQRALTYVLGDGRFVCATLDTAIRARAAGANVYLYNFDGVDPDAVGDAGHGAELPYLFGTLRAPHHDDLVLSDTLQRYWANFAAYGAPDDGMDPYWIALGSRTHWRMNLSCELELLKAYREHECDFWLGVYDQEF